MFYLFIIKKKNIKDETPLLTATTKMRRRKKNQIKYVWGVKVNKKKKTQALTISMQKKKIEK